MQKPSGTIFVDGFEVATTLQCCHCGNHFVSIRGSGIQRGFCLKCQAVTCGSPECHICVPFEKWLEGVERAAKNAVSV
jgi:hypothetical protein